MNPAPKGLASRRSLSLLADRSAMLSVTASNRALAFSYREEGFGIGDMGQDFAGHIVVDTFLEGNNLSVFGFLVVEDVVFAVTLYFRIFIDTPVARSYIFPW